MKIIVLTGPTATGKSDLSLKIADEFNCEIINSDSMQVYKYFDIGTAKPPKEILQKYPHHLLSYVEPDDTSYSAMKFVEDADNKIKEVVEKGKIPLIVGGTGLYIKCLLFGIFEEENEEVNFRNTFKNIAKNYGHEYLFTKLKIIDYKAWQKINRNDLYRTIRALDFYYRTGKLISIERDKHKFSQKRYDYIKIAIKFDRKKLYDKINKRVDKMIELGLIEETYDLIKKGYANSRPMQGIGYREIKQYLEGKLKKKQAIELIKQNTRKYAKRQITWFKKENDINWISNFNEVKNLIKNHIAT